MKNKDKIMEFEKKDLLVMGGEKSIGKPSLNLEDLLKQKETKMNKKIHEGDLTITKDTKLDYTYITGFLRIEKCSKLDVPNLTSIGESVFLDENSKLDASNLTSIGGYVHLEENIKLDASNLTSIGESVFLYGNIKLDTPKLTYIGGDVQLDENIKLDAPNLTSIGGYVHLYESSEFIHAKKFKENDPKTKYKCRKLLHKSFIKNGFVLADRILSKIISTRKTKTLTIYKTDKGYVVYDGYNYSHGETLKEAKEDLIYKISNRDKSKYESMTLETVLTKKEYIEMYRVITGACGLGTKDFCKGNKKLKAKMSIKEIIEITKSQYGNGMLVEFFNKKGE